MATESSYTERDVRAWIAEASCGSAAAALFPFDTLAGCELQNVHGNVVHFNRLYAQHTTKKTILMFGRNLL